MSFKKIAPKELQDNLIKMIADEWMLITAGNESKYNMMTASWGFAGEIWGKDCAIVLIRPQRYTLQFIDNCDYFTLNFLGDNKSAHKVCGSQSGRDIDKSAETGLIPVFKENAILFEQSRISVLCKKLYKTKIEKEGFIDESALKWYPDNDFHYVFVGEIIDIFVKE